MNDNVDKITIVVPCYNVEKYLKRCLDSLCNQTYTNIEVIMVEDCSTDGTKEIVKRYEERYDNFRAIYNEKNGGLGHARNVGIAATRTKYIGFLDSDDWLPENFLSEMYDALVANGAEISVCDIYLRYDDSKKDQRILAYNTQPDKYGLINTGMAASSSNKLYKTELFDNIRYPEGIVNEDIPVILALLSNYRVAYNAKTHLNYYQRAGSIQNGQVDSRRLEVFKAVTLLRENLGGKVDQRIWQVIVWHQIFAVLLFVFPRATGVLKRRDLIAEFYEVASKNNIKISKNNIGFRDFAKHSKAQLIYGRKIAEHVNNKHFLAASLLMGCYNFLVNHKSIALPAVKLTRLATFSVRHPGHFVRIYGGRIKRRILRKNVIKLNVGLDDLVSEAKRQNKLPSTHPVSVIIPNYNYERFLVQRIYSILSQTEKVGEIIILDDNSTDNSVKLAEKIRGKINKYVPVRTINNQDNLGTFTQWENGFSEARHEYVWIAEADDYSDVKFLQTAIAPCLNNPSVVMSYVNTGYVDEKGLLLGNVKNDIDYQKCGHWNKDYVNNGFDEAKNYTYLNNTIANVSSVLFRKKKNINYKKLFVDARRYRQAGDWVFYVNYMVYGDIAYTDKIHNYYRLHGNNVSSTTKAQDHINEILEIQRLFIAKLKLNKQQQKKMTKRITMLKKAWNV